MACVNEAIEAALGPTIKEIAELLKSERGQFLLVGPDRLLLEGAQELICGETGYRPIDITTGRHESPDRKIFFLQLLSSQSLEYQSLLYYYLELPLHHDCFVCLVSTSSLCLNSLEKRVRSRFRNRVFFVPYLVAQIPEAADGPRMGALPARRGQKTRISKAGVEPPPCIFPSLEHKAREEFMERYKLEPFTLSYLLDLLEPVHLALIIAARKHRITPANALDVYRKSTVNINEIKGAQQSSVLFCYYDLVDAGLIGAGGMLMVDFGECQDYILNKCPRFLKRMLGASQLLP